MIVCGVDLKGSDARLAVVTVKDEIASYLPTKTKKITLADDKDSASIKNFLQTLKSFAHENHVDVFAIKARAKSGQMAGGAISFKIETLFQLSDCDVVFINAVALSTFVKTNAGGVPGGLLKYQEDAFRCGAFQLKKAGEL